MPLTQHLLLEEPHATTSLKQDTDSFPAASASLPGRLPLSHLLPLHSVGPMHCGGQAGVCLVQCTSDPSPPLLSPLLL